MKTISKFIIVCLLAALTVSCATNSNNWKLVWEENFEQSNGFDTVYWSKIPRGGSDWNNYMSYLDVCYDMREGNMILRGIVNPEKSTDTVPYITGGIYTKDKICFEPIGRVEIKAKLKGATGAWPAIWMLSQNGGWPNGGEIDIMERLNYDTIAYQTIHSYYTHVLGIGDNPPKGSTGAINPNDYNIYGVELYPDSVCLYINNHHTITYPRIVTDKEGQFPFNDAFYLLIDMQLGGSWVGEVNPNDLPVEMWIDWVRYYQK